MRTVGRTRSGKRAEPIRKKSFSLNTTRMSEKYPSFLMKGSGGLGQRGIGEGVLLQEGKLKGIS